MHPKRPEASSLPTEQIGIPRLDRFAAEIARLYEKGSLVSIDKLSRIPPLDAPLDPSWFGDASETQQGSVTRRVSMRVSIIDEKTLEGIEKRRQALRRLLNRFSFGLADNMRWMPHAARRLFEAELDRVNSEGQKIIADLFKGDVNAFVEAKKSALVTDINAMYQQDGRTGQVGENVIGRVVKSLLERLSKAQVANLMPKLTYAHIAFSVTDNAWASPWGQAYSLLSDVAMFPRKALTDSFFFRGLKVRDDDLIQAMNVADDHILRGDAPTRGIKDRCRAELDILARVERSSIDVRAKCELVWSLLRGDGAEAVATGLAEREKA